MIFIIVSSIHPSKGRVGCKNEEVINIKLGRGTSLLLRMRDHAGFLLGLF
jgi:hypothetical protein